MNNLIKSFTDAFFSRYIVYTKIFQWFNVKSSSYMGKKISNLLGVFTDKAPFVDSDIDRDAIKTLKKQAVSLGYDLDLSEIPLNSGTISLVFKGVMRRGDEVKNIAVKIQRTGIVLKVKNALETVDFILGLMNYIPYLKTANIRESFTDSIDCLSMQTDFANEINNIELVYKALKNYKKAKVVYVYRELCSDTCIVMNFIEGKSLLELSSDEKKLYIEPCASVTAFMNFKKFINHLDIHPGNILFVNENGCHKVCFLDMGMIMRTNIDETECLFEFVMLVYSDTTLDKICQFLINYKEVLVYNPDKIQDFISFIKLNYQKHSILKNKDIQSITMDISYLIYSLKGNGLVINKSFNKLIVGFVSFLGTFSNLDSDGVFRKIIVEKLNSYVFK